MPVKAFKIRLDQINFALSLSLSPRFREAYGRDTRITEHVADMVEFLRAGGTLPPLRLHQGSMAIVDGLNRGLAHKHFAGDLWEASEVDAVWDEQCPDPEASPVGFTLRSAQLNAANGLPLKGAERQEIIRKAYEAGGEPGVEAAARCLGMTVEKARHLLHHFQAVAERLGLPDGQPPEPRGDHPLTGAEGVQPREFLSVEDRRFVRGLQLMLAAFDEGWRPAEADKRTARLCQRAMEALEAVTAQAS